MQDFQDDLFDYVIVGAGSAGCLLANRLSADPNTRVLLIEAGGTNKNFWVDVPLGIPFLHGNPRFDWCYQSQPEPYLNGRTLPLPRGRGLGGSSAINGMVYVRGHASDFDQWRQMGNVGWGWDDVLPYFRRYENREQGEAGGELKIGVAPYRWPILDVYMDAAKQAGYSRLQDYNSGGGREGFGLFELTVANGKRWSTYRAFLEPVMHRSNLTVVTDATVERIIFDGRRACGIAYRRDGKPEQAKTRGEVILSAGAYGSPHLLQLSGVGPAGLLSDVGIDVVADLPGVGENLHDHWMLRVLHRVKNARTLNSFLKTPLHKAAMGAGYLLGLKSPMGAPVSLLTGFVRSDRAVETPDIQLQISIASYEKVGGPTHPWPGIGTSVCIARPTSRGWLRLQSPDPTARPAILHNYLATEEDQRIALSGMRIVRRILSQPAFQPHEPEEIMPTARVASDEELLDYARNNIGSVFHPVGTCRMGQDTMAVTDERLRVRGFEGLRIVDASVMPTITSGNTNAPVIMIAEKGAEMIRQDRMRTS